MWWTFSSILSIESHLVQCVILLLPLQSLLLLTEKGVIINVIEGCYAVGLLLLVLTTTYFRS